MPFYEYFCKNCKKSVDIYKSMSDESPEICKKCGEITYKQISTGMFKLNGSGWSKDLYVKGENKNEP